MTIITQDAKTINFIKRAKATHGERYDYSETIFEGSHANVTIICKEHGQFTRRATDHSGAARAQGCSDCGDNGNIAPKPTKHTMVSTNKPDELAKSINALPQTQMTKPVNEVITLSKDKVRKLIRQRFETLEIMTKEVCDIDSHHQCLVISGSKGVGKTFGCLKALTDSNITYERVSGAIGKPGLFEALYNTREQGILFLDDVDVFGDIDMLNLFKAALDSNDRTVSYGKQLSKEMKEKNLEKKFQYDGKIIFSTNLNVNAIIARGGKMAEDLDAILDRGVFVDLLIHDNQSKMLHIENVIEDTDLLTKDKHSLSKPEQESVLQYMRDNLNEMRSISLRVPQTIAQYLKADPEGWTKLADDTMLVQKQIVIA